MTEFICDSGNIKISLSLMCKKTRFSKKRSCEAEI